MSLGASSARKRSGLCNLENPNELLARRDTFFKSYIKKRSRIFFIIDYKRSVIFFLFYSCYLKNCSSLPLILKIHHSSPYLVIHTAEPNWNCTPIVYWFCIIKDTQLSTEDRVAGLRTLWQSGLWPAWQPDKTNKK